MHQYKKSILAFVLILGAVFASWKMFYHEPTYGEAFHQDLQEKLQTSLIEKMLPNQLDAVEYEVKKLWTKTIKKGQVEGAFAVSFKNKHGDMTEKTGRVILNQVGNGRAEDSQWVLDKVDMKGIEFDFNEPLVFRSSDK